MPKLFHGRYAIWLESCLPGGHWQGKDYVALCIFHPDHNPSLAIHGDDGMFVCRSCHMRGNINTLARKLGVSPQITVDDESLRLAIEAIEVAPRRFEDPQTLPVSYLRRYQHPDPYWPTRFTAETIERYQLGHDPLTQCATIPWFDPRGRLLGVIMRNLDPDVQPKYSEPRGLPKGNWLWGAHLVPRQPEVLVICEGPVDAMAVSEAGYPAVALCSSLMTEEQARWVNRIQPARVLVGLDNDRAGRGQPRKITERRGRRGRLYEKVTPASGTFLIRERLPQADMSVITWSAKDPAELGVDERVENIVWADPWDEWLTET
jgi:hypothetical protein